MATQQYAPGDKVRFIGGVQHHGAWSPDSSREVQNGDILTSYELFESRGYGPAFRYRVNSGKLYSLPLSVVEPIVAPSVCTCDVFTVLMVTGCRCGQIQRERQP